MTSVEAAIRAKFRTEIAKTDMNEVSDDLRRIAASDGLGVAILVAWQQGLRIGHIPVLPLRPRNTTRNEPAPQARTIAASDSCPYLFVHVPVRQFRGDVVELKKRKIMNPDADPAWFIYHEDGLVGAFSFQNPEVVELSRGDLRDIIDALAQQGVLVRANLNNRQIQFKDQAAKKRIEESGEDIYVRIHNKPLERGQVRLPAGLDRPDVWKYVRDALKNRSACNYCSAQALLPHEVTMHSMHPYSRTEQWKGGFSTVRNYQIGFTFAPFGDPRSVCHFLAWDFPHINDLVMNMEPQAYSFSDLITLVRVINRDIKNFCESSAAKVKPTPGTISGICNHWAGNSIYHQHYQFFRISGLPLERAGTHEEPLASFRGVEVRKVSGSWPAPAYIIRSSEPDGDEAVMRVADRVAREWRALSEGEDLSYGNEIAIKNHTQNTFVTFAAGELSAVFIPRHRGRRSTRDPKNTIQKSNAGVLEMMGYFVIDDPVDFRKLTRMSARRRKAIGDSWLSELAPEGDSIQEFERNVRICLSDAVTPYEEQIDEILAEATGDPRREARELASTFQRDTSLNHEQREHLHRELLSAVLDACAEGWPQVPRD